MHPSGDAIMHDADVRQATWKMINKRKCNNGPDVLKIDEFDLCCEVRADIAIINGHITGYELKSAKDNLRRLPKQVLYYSKIMDYCNLVVSDNHLEKAMEIIPDYWGIYLAKVSSSGKVYIRKQRSPLFNGAYLDPYAIAQLLWRPEILTILDDNGIPRGKGYQNRFTLWDTMAENFSLTELRRITRETLKRRVNWR